MRHILKISKGVVRHIIFSLVMKLFASQTKATSIIPSLYQWLCDFRSCDLIFFTFVPVMTHFILSNDDIPDMYSIVLDTL